MCKSLLVKCTSGVEPPISFSFLLSYQVFMVTSHIAIGKRVRVMDVDKQGLWQTFGEGMLSVMSGVP